jgi:hypothetical protein
MVLNKTKLRFVIPDKFRFELVQQVSLYKKGDFYFLSLVYVKNPQKQEINLDFQAFDLGVDSSQDEYYT